MFRTNLASIFERFSSTQRFVNDSRSSRKLRRAGTCKCTCARAERHFNERLRIVFCKKHRAYAAMIRGVLKHDRNPKGKL